MMSCQIGWILPLKMIFEILKTYVKLNKFMSTWTKVQILCDEWGREVVYIYPRGQRGSFSATDFISYETIEIASSASIRVNGKMTAAEKPGLGIEPNFNVLGNEVLSFS